MEAEETGGSGRSPLRFGCIRQGGRPAHHSESFPSPPRGTLRTEPRYPARETDSVKTRFADGRYEVLRTLGQGATSEVLEVLDTRLGARRALKRMVEAPTPDARARQEREAAVMARLDHPNVVTVIDAFEEDGQRCVVMELCEGGSLATRVALDGPLPPAEVVAIGAVLQDALAAAHESGVLHRDLKPHNILFGPRGDPRIADFGLSWVSQDDATLTRTGALLGTVPFMAPELRRGEPHTESTDRYALAATLAWSATGTFPPDLDRVGALDGLPEPVAVFLGGLLVGDERVPEAEVQRRRSRSRHTRRLLGGLAIGGAALGGGLLRPVPPAALPAGTLSAYEQLPLCNPELGGDFSFTRSDKYPRFDTDPRLPEEAQAPQLADLDGDGDPDLVVTYLNGAAIDIFLNQDGKLVQRDADGVPAPPIRLTADVSNASTTHGDLEGDGREEVLWLSRDRLTAHVLRIDASGKPLIEAHTMGDPVETPVLVDLNGDRCDDLLFVMLSAQPRLHHRMGRCDGTFELESYITDGWAGVIKEQGRLVLFDAEGDIALFDRSTFRVTPVPVPPGLELWANARGGLDARRGALRSSHAGIGRMPLGIDASGALCRSPLDRPSRGDAAVADLDGDGWLDRVTTNSCGYCSSEVTVTYGAAEG